MYIRNTLLKSLYCIQFTDELTVTNLKDTFNKSFGAEKVQYSVRTIARPLQDFKMTYNTAADTAT